MGRARPVHVHAEAEELAGLELVELALEQERVGAEVDVPPPLHQGPRDRGDLRVQQGLPPGDAHHRRAALVGGGHALRDREVPLEDRRGVLYFSTSSAREIAAEQGLQHQHQRIALPAGEALLHHVSGHCQHLRCRNRHALPSPGRRVTSRPRLRCSMYRPGCKECATTPLGLPHPAIVRPRSRGLRPRPGRRRLAGQVQYRQIGFSGHPAHRRASFRAAQVPLMPRWLSAKS